MDRVTVHEITAYLRRIMPYFALSVSIFIMGVVLGVLVVRDNVELADRIRESVMGFDGNFHGLSKAQLAAAIFFNNGLKSLGAMFLGVLLGVVPLLMLLVNGAALGALVFLAIPGRGLAPTLLAIVPHGILELPAVWLATSVGLMLGGLAIKRFARKTEINLRDELARAGRFFWVTIIPLLLFAALIEAYLTPIIARH
jgi:stage II sporulation protein M